METLVLCPEELCLGPARLTPSGLMGLSPSFASEFSIWTSGDLEKGTRFLPWKGTVRSDKLPVHDKLPEFDVRHRFGLYDEISEVLPGRRLRQCNWIRFLRYSLVCNEEINVIGTKGPTGEPVFELIRDVGPKTELVAFFVPERPEEAFLLPAIQYLRHTLFKRLIDNVLEESPLDLSTSLVMSKVFNQHAAAAAVHPAIAAGTNHLSTSHHIPGASQPSPAHSVEGRKSVSSDCTTSTLESDVPRPPTISTSEALHFTHSAVAAARRSLLEKVPTSSITSHYGSRSSTMISETPPPPPPLTPTMSSLSRSSSSPTAGISPVASVTPTAPTRRREKNMLPCNYCGKCFDRPSLLKRHIRIHTGERPHVCDICNKGFSTSSSLNTHRRIHSGEKPHQCGVCGKRFTASSNLYYHKMTHVKEKPHKCTMCSKSFPTPGDLKSHTYVHTGTWPFKCHVCHRGFSKQTNLKNHLLLHSGDKPFSCDICQKKFALSCNLRAHLKTHEAEYQTSPASFALYRRTLELLGVAEAQERIDRMRDETEEEDEEERLGSESSSPGAAGIVPESNTSNPSPSSPHNPDEDEEVVMEDVEEDEPDPTRISPPIMGHSITQQPSPSVLLSATTKPKPSGSKSRLPLGIDDYAQQLRNQIAA